MFFIFLRAAHFGRLIFVIALWLCLQALSSILNFLSDALRKHDWRCWFILNLFNSFELCGLVHRSCEITTFFPVEVVLQRSDDILNLGESVLISNPFLAETGSQIFIKSKVRYDIWIEWRLTSSWHIGHLSWVPLIKHIDLANYLRLSLVSF